MYKTNKVLVLDRLMREHDKLELLINRAGFVQRLTMKGASGNWSVKEALAQILAREQFISDRLEEILNGDRHIPCKTQTDFHSFLDNFGYPDFESSLLSENQPHEWVAAKYKNIPFDEIVAQEIQAFSGITSSLEKMTEEKLGMYDLIDLVAKHTYRYYRRHTLSISNWLNYMVVNTK